MSVCLEKNEGSLGSTSLSRNEDYVPSTFLFFKATSGLEILQWLDNSRLKHECVKQLQNFKAAREKAWEELTESLKKTRSCVQCLYPHNQNILRNFVDNEVEKKQFMETVYLCLILYMSSAHCVGIPLPKATIFYKILIKDNMLMYNLSSIHLKREMLQ